MTLVKCQYSRRSHCAINGGVPDTEVNIYILYNGHENDVMFKINLYNDQILITYCP